jgi:uncharacterized protein (TIGR03000 family)
MRGGPEGTGSGSGKGPEGGGSPKGSPGGSGTTGGGSTSLRSAPQAPARLVIDVPEDARVFVDDHLMKSSSTHRVYASPKLDAGQAYYYDVRIEVDRDGKVVSANKRVIVRAGEEYTESFVNLGKATTAVATK